MRRFLLCSGVYGKKAAIEGLRRLATDRRPEAVLFAGGILSSQRRAVPCSTGLWGLTPEDERFAIEFGAALGALGVFSAVIQEPNFVPEDQFCRLAMAVELEFPNVHVAHATLVEAHDVAVCGLGIAVAEQAPDARRLLLPGQRPVLLARLGLLGKAAEGTAALGAAARPPGGAGREPHRR